LEATVGNSEAGGRWGAMDLCGVWISVLRGEGAVGGDPGNSITVQYREAR
jgi:hypothetical protein